jgi:molybdate transport system ATP-binding protein
MAGADEAGTAFEAQVAAQDEAFGLTALDFFGGRLRVPRLELGVGDRVRTTVRARDVSIALERPDGISIQNVLPGRVLETADIDGVHVDIRIGMGEGALLARVTRHAAHALELAPGRPVFAMIKSVALERSR